jgi:signal transduction histidine kinase
VTVSPIRGPTTAVSGLSAVARDISEKKHAEEVRRSLEERLQQSERLESIGQLAGGVAHDFNNLLGVILNYAALVAEAVGDDAAVQADVKEILDATERAVRLTRQLLMFARREPANAEPLRLNAVVEDVRALLANSLGEHIALIVRPGRGLPSIRADQGQIEQVLLNLAVNARDAMLHGGTLTIDTTSLSIDATHAVGSPDVPAGPYVRLSVSDTGSGMPPEVVARAFEPFFTTKPKGEGTGLGLATVYGIVSDAGGAVMVHSEVGVGTTFELYFPAAAGDTELAPVDARTAPARGEGATVLVVEDQDAVRAITVRLLRRNGYHVLEAATGAQAIALAAEHRVQLLLTDVVMPVTSGAELAKSANEVCPRMHVLFMSGHPDDAIARHGVLAPGIQLIAKPFTPEALARRIRDVLESDPPRGS